MEILAKEVLFPMSVTSETTLFPMLLTLETPLFPMLVSYFVCYRCKQHRKQAVSDVTDIGNNLLPMLVTSETKIFPMLVTSETNCFRCY